MRLLQFIDLENNIMATTTARKKGKTVFVKEVLTKNPLANTAAVNNAWKSAGQTGSISATLVNKQRAALGLAGNLRAKSKPKTDSAPIDRRIVQRQETGSEAEEHVQRHRTAHGISHQWKKDRPAGHQDRVAWQESSSRVARGTGSRY